MTAARADAPSSLLELIGEIFVDLGRWLQEHGQNKAAQTLRLHFDRPLGRTQEVGWRGWDRGTRFSWLIIRGQVFRLIERQANLHKAAAHLVKERKSMREPKA